MPFVSHPLIRPGVLEDRAYQSAILQQALGKNILCVLPTGMGKTPIAVRLAAHRLEQFPDSHILILAPTRPLVLQHLSSFKKFLAMPEEEFQLVTGQLPAEKRKNAYTSKLLFATPQTIKNDLENSLFSLHNFSLVVFDESHHAVGGYAYPIIAEAYRQQANSRILALTASPGSDLQKIQSICTALHIESVEIRSEKDDDVSPYMQDKSVEWVTVQLPASFQKVQSLLKSALQKRAARLKKWHLSPKPYLSKKDLLQLQRQLFPQLSTNPVARACLSTVTQLIKLDHALTLLETQSIPVLETYWKKLRAEEKGGTKKLLADSDVSSAMFLTQSLLDQQAHHPKISRLCSLIADTLQKNPSTKTIIFANYRDTVKEIVSVLANVGGARPIEFTGQKDLTQKRQQEILNEFRLDLHNVLVCTSVGEEGIDIPEMDMAIFYEPVPSGIRSIQRRGRVGRSKVGRVLVFMAEGTRDEGAYWSAHRKEKDMRATLHGMKTFGI